MKLRDKFAAEALNALITKLPLQLGYEGDEEVDALYVIMAKSAYNYADAMMEVREIEN